jgi:hypothetical protein
MGRGLEKFPQVKLSNGTVYGVWRELGGILFNFYFI